MLLLKWKIIILISNIIEIGLSSILKSNNMQRKPFEKIMIFARPGSGKSTFALWLAHTLNLPLYHLDKHFYTNDWVERNYQDFLSIQQNIVNSRAWIVDGNSTGSLEMRWAQADLVLYFNFSKPLCYYRVLKRFSRSNNFDDRAPGCYETVRFPFLKYIWTFEKRVAQQVEILKEKYPNAAFQEVKSEHKLKQLTENLHEQYRPAINASLIQTFNPIISPYNTSP